MHCQFFSNGLAISYNNIVKPCCSWQVDDEWKEHHQLAKIDLIKWHQHPLLLQKRRQLNSMSWPSNCSSCQQSESLGRQDSMRHNGNRAYAHYCEDDITLEIRPGSTCNFACQTCWPEASSRVAQYQHQLGMIDINKIDSRRLDDFSFLIPIADRIKDVVLLGGEPFYDKACQKFITWAQQNLSANLLLFTNGSCIDWEFLNSYCGKITLVFSLDAMGKPAEYIRDGTIWNTVYENFIRCRSLPNVETRVNVTTSVYNFVYLEELLDWLCQDWPALVTFGSANNPIFREHVIPLEHRNSLNQSLERTMIRLMSADIPSDQKSNALNAIRSIRDNLSTEFSHDMNQKFLNYVTCMDSVKFKSMAEYCPELATILKQKIN